MGEFSPVQLDALEDALEDLELTGIPPEFEDDPAVSGRLAEYRDLLQLSREALPSVEVPTGVLDSVLAAARDEAALPAVAPQPRRDDAAESKPPWWKRLSLWVPGLAVCASAALVLVMLQGTLGDAEPATATVGQAKAKAEQQVEFASKSSPPGVLRKDGDALQAAAEPAMDPSSEDGRIGLGAPQSRGRLRGSAAVEGAAGDFESALENEEDQRAEADAMPAEVPSGALPEPEPEPEPTDKVLYDEKERVSPGPSKKQTSKKTPAPSRPSETKRDAPSSKGGGTKKPKPKAPGGGAVERQDDADSSASLATADRNRRTGRCTAARGLYRGLVDHADASVRARALAGLGLCALADGDDKGAEAYFSRARKANPGIGGFISRERDSVEETPQQAL